MPRATQHRRKPEQNDISLSQQSASSDDSANMLAVVAQQMQASWEKKKKEKENKFLQFGRKQLEEKLTAHTTRLARKTEEMNQAYESFVAAYAAAEDEIRALWEQIVEEQGTFLDLARRKSSSASSAESAREDAHLQGMAQCKRACEDLGTLVSTLTQ